MIRRLLCAAAVAVLLVMVGCGKSEPQVDTTVFEQPIRDYLRTQSMGVEVKKFVDAKIEGDTATAVAKMVASEEGVAGVQVQWTFTFAKDENGNWKVVGRQE